MSTMPMVTMLSQKIRSLILVLLNSKAYPVTHIPVAKRCTENMRTSGLLCNLKNATVAIKEEIPRIK